MKQAHNEPLADKELVHHVCHTLEEHSFTPTSFDNTLEKLAEHARETRQARLQHAVGTKRWLLLGSSFALAASVALITLLPLTTAFTSHSPSAISPVAEITQATTPSVDPQFLQDMDMLIVLAEESQ